MIALFKLEQDSADYSVTNIDIKMKMICVRVHPVGKPSSVKSIFCAPVQCMMTSGENVFHSIPDQYHGLMLIELSHHKIDR